MKVFWWQNGLHFEPETGDERKALSLLLESAKLTRLSAEEDSGCTPASPLGNHRAESLVTNS